MAFPPWQLRTERELDKIKGFKLVEVWLERNPLCDHFKDQPNYIRSVHCPGAGRATVREELGIVGCMYRVCVCVFGGWGECGYEVNSPPP